jgi:tetratricopeptide (TPR) repeat protein
MTGLVWGLFSGRRFMGSPLSRMRMKRAHESLRLLPGCSPLLGERGRGEGLLGSRFMGRYLVTVLLLLAAGWPAFGGTNSTGLSAAPRIPPLPSASRGVKGESAGPPLPAGSLSELNPQPVAGGNASALFDAANKLYDAGEYSEAAAGYLGLLRTGRASAAVYFNLGNACFKTGHLGRAIAAYRVALELEPRDPDAQANLRFARAQVQGTTLAESWLERFLGKLSLNEWTWAAAGAVWVFFLLLTLRQVRPAWKRSMRSWLVADGLAAVLLCGALGAAYYQARGEPVAIVVASDAVVRQGPLDEAKSVFTAHDGAELRVLDRKDNWLQVATDAQHLGWLRRDEVLLSTDLAHNT